MSPRVGNPFPAPTDFIAAAAVGAAGRSFTFPTGPIALGSVTAQWTASGTVGNRTVQMQIKDANGNILMRLPAFTAITAGQSVTLFAVNAATFQSFTGPPLVQTMPLPADVPLAAGTVITVVDTAAIDPNDTCSIAITASN